MVAIVKIDGDCNAPATIRAVGFCRNYRPYSVTVFISKSGIPRITTATVYIAYCDATNPPFAHPANHRGLWTQDKESNEGCNEQSRPSHPQNTNCLHFRHCMDYTFTVVQLPCTPLCRLQKPTRVQARRFLPAPVVDGYGFTQQVMGFGLAAFASQQPLVEQPQALVQTPLVVSQQDLSALQQPATEQQEPLLQQLPPTQHEGVAALAALVEGWAGTQTVALPCMTNCPCVSAVAVLTEQHAIRLSCGAAPDCAAVGATANTETIAPTNAARHMM
jgi:hypothetical protein